MVCDVWTIKAAARNRAGRIFQSSLPGWKIQAIVLLAV